MSDVIKRWNAGANSYAASSHALGGKRTIAAVVAAAYPDPDFRRSGAYLAFVCEQVRINPRRLLRFLRLPDPGEGLEEARVVVTRLANKLLAADLLPTVVDPARPAEVSAVSSLGGELVQLKAARDLLPGRPSVSTIWRWHTKGLDGVRLDCWLVGRRMYTSGPALKRFAERRLAQRNEGGGTDAVAGPAKKSVRLPAATPAVEQTENRRREIRRAVALLDRDGF